MNNRKRQKIGQRKFKNSEVWDIGFVLARIIHKGLVQYKYANRMGVPSEFEGKEQEWEDIIDKMIWGFHEVGYDYPSSPINLKFAEFHRQNPNYTFKTIKDDNGCRISFADYVQLTEEDYEANKQFYAQVEEALTLFAKYISNLWD